MRLVIRDSYEEVSVWAATYIVKKINEFKSGPDKYFILGLPTGSTPLGMYKKLIEFFNEGKVSFKYVKTFNMDEYVDLPKDHQQSYHYYMWNNFFRKIDILPSNVFLLDGNAGDLQAECDKYEQKIAENNGIDLFVGGIGPDGHIAFNEPGSSLASRTRVKTLAQDTIQANARFFDDDLDQVPKRALTVGVATVMEAREVLILVTGSSKAFALYKAVEEGINHMWTVSAFQQHPRTIVVCDDDATLELRVKTVKYFKSIQDSLEALPDVYSLADYYNDKEFEKKEEQRRQSKQNSHSKQSSQSKMNSPSKERESQSKERESQSKERESQSKEEKEREKERERLAKYKAFY